MKGVKKWLDTSDDHYISTWYVQPGLNSLSSSTTDNQGPISEPSKHPALHDEGCTS